jgi:hypothetical protein
VAQTVDEPTPAGAQASVTAPVAPPATAPGPETSAPDSPRPAPWRRQRADRPKPGPRRTRVTVRRVGPLSVLKFSLIFYFCVMLAVLLGLVFLFMILQAVGVIDTIEKWLTDFFPRADGGTFQIEPGYLLPRLFLIGCGAVVIWSLINLVVAFLYNLISDVVGGIEITLSEKK